MKKLASFLLVFCITLSSFCFTASASYKTKGFKVKSEAAALVSLDTDDILFEKNIDQKRYPASITKIMTAVILLGPEALSCFNHKNYDSSYFVG